MYLDTITEIIKLINDMVNGDAYYWQMDKYCDMSSRQLELLFNYNSLIDGNGEIRAGVTAQDIINVFVLCYSMKSYHHFLTVGFGQKYMGQADPR